MAVTPPIFALVRSSILYAMIPWAIYPTYNVLFLSSMVNPYVPLIAPPDSFLRGKYPLPEVIRLVKVRAAASQK